MTGRTPRQSEETQRAKAQDEARRAAALRENLKRRKDQQRRREAKIDDQDEQGRE